jgi:hypothetical protein
MRFVSLALVLGLGCATPVAPLRPLVPEHSRPEMRELPADARTAPLPEGTSTDLPEDFVIPLEHGDIVQEPGLQVSESRAVRDAQIRIGYEELRRYYLADIQVWRVHRELYETQRAADAEAIRGLQPTWWDDHGGVVIGSVTFVVGAALTVALVKAVNAVGGE